MKIDIGIPEKSREAIAEGGFGDWRRAFYERRL